MAYRTDAHEKHDDGAVHAHISSPIFYTAIFLALVVLTVTTVGQSYFDLGRASIAIVILIASMKASLVVAFFMHLRYDNKFNALIFISGLAFIGVFFAYTMNDTERRGELDGDQNVIVLPRTGENAPGHFDQLTPAHSAEPAGSGAAPHGGSAPPPPGGQTPPPPGGEPQHH
jgi:cytochrome c oxidase subunit 4